jgi:hypothetical protein
MTKKKLPQDEESLNKLSEKLTLDVLRKVESHELTAVDALEKILSYQRIKTVEHTVYRDVNQEMGYGPHSDQRKW